MLKKIMNLFRKNQEEKESKKKLLWGIVIGIIVAAIVIAVLLAIAWPKIFSSDSPAKLKLTVITKENCTQCWDVKLFTDALQQYNVKIISSSTLYYDSGKGKDLVNKYKIEKIPTLIIEGDLNKDQKLKPFWKALGEIDGNKFIFRQIIPPYINVSNGQIKGLVGVTYLSDRSCPQCYDVRVHQNALRNLAIPTDNVKSFDISSPEGKALVQKYDIKLIPTMILSGEISEYGNLSELWNQIGKVAKDGAYVFTQVQLMGTYKDLSKNKIITPPPATSTSTTTK